VSPSPGADESPRAAPGRAVRSRGRGASSDAVVITVAPTGSEVTRTNNPNVPYTPAEIVAEAVRAGNAGAGVVHVHVRDDDGRPSAEQGRFVAVVGGIRASSNLLSCVSTGGGTGMTMEERLAGAHSDPDAIGVETGSLNFSGHPFVTSAADTAKVIETASSYGKPLEVEAFDLGHIVDAAELIAKGALPPATPFNLVFGVKGGAPATASALRAMADHVPPASAWTITAIGRHQTPMLLQALLMGAPGIRVGFEDNVYLRRGLLAGSNAELVELAVSLADLIGRRPAEPDECRAYFGLPAT
jgi:3-keto-5-aminohexanoate cleavage enzyme